MKKIKYHKLEKTKGGFRLHLPRWCVEALLFDPKGRIDVCVEWDSTNPDVLMIRRATDVEAYIQCDTENNELSAAHANGELDIDSIQKDVENFKQYLVWAAEGVPEDLPQWEPVQPGVLGLSPYEAKWFAKVPKNEEFTLETFIDMGAPKGTGQRVINKLKKLRLIREARQEKIGGRGRPRIWYVRYDAGATQNK